VLILAPGHPLVEKKWFRIGDLLSQPFVLREPGSSTREVLERVLRERGVEPRVVMELGSTEAVKRTVAAGLAISFVSEHAVELETRAGALVTRRVPALTPARGLYAVRRRTLHLSRLHERFLAMLVQMPVPETGA
jgi:DNA-binding transcriptional LysR family regulator